MSFDKPVVRPSDIPVIMSFYPFGDVLECDSLGGGNNPTFKAVTEEKTVAVRVCTPSDWEHISLEVKVLQHLAERDFKALRLLPGKNGKVLQQWNNQWVCVTEFLDGVRVDTIPLTPNIVGDVGRIVASYQRAMDSFQIETIPKGRTFIDRGIRVMASLYPTLNKRGWDIDFGNVIPLWERASEPFTKYGSDLNVNVIHADIWPANVMCDGERVIALIDFGDCLFGAPMIDTAIALMEFSMYRDTEMDKDLALAFLTEYFRYGGSISALEETLIVNAMEMMCAIWVGSYVMQQQEFVEGRVVLRRVNLFSNDKYRQKMQDDVERLIRAARTIAHQERVPC
jgi:Ser/Thr protein kinase RdoA (MazF antagonist)